MSECWKAQMVFMRQRSTDLRNVRLFLTSRTDSTFATILMITLRFPRATRCTMVVMVSVIKDDTMYSFPRKNAD